MAHAWTAMDRMRAEMDDREVSAIMVEQAVSGDPVAWVHIMEARVDVHGIPWAEVARWSSSTWGHLS